MTSVDTQYHVLEEGQTNPPTITVVEARPAPYVYVVRSVERRRRSYCGGCCCLMVLLLVLLLALFVPRSPDIGFDQLSVGKSDDGVPNLLVDLRFHSKQPVTTSWKDLDVTLEWKKNYDDDDKVEDIAVAEFERNSEFSTGAYASKHLHPGLKAIDATQATLFVGQCGFGTEGVVARLKGTVKQGGTKFDVSTRWTQVFCYY